MTIPLEPDLQTGWKTYPQFRGPTANTDDLSCHVSVLVENHSPHPPCGHPEEEILLVLAGEVELILPQADSTPRRDFRLRAGQFVYYPAYFLHTLRTVSSQPANYLILKWRARSGVRAGHLDFGCFDGVGPREGAPEHRLQLLFEGPTTCLRKLHAHATTLPPGAGHPTDVHSYEFGIVVFEGEVETLGERVGPHGIIFCAGGNPHSIYNRGAVPARYVVFEFHGIGAGVSFLRKVTDPRRWTRKLKSIVRL